MDQTGTHSQQVVDFSNTEIAFASKSNSELRKTARMFRLMNNPWLVALGSNLALLSTRLRLPLSEKAIERTIFDIFCGGKTLAECQPVIERLYRNNVFTVLDFGAEAKSTNEELDSALQEFLRAVEFAASNASVPVVSTKVTGIADNDLLIKWQSGTPFDEQERLQFGRIVDRLDTLCSTARKLGVRIFIDAEESWMQNTIDYLVEMMMERYNHELAVVYNTYQLYRTDKLEHLHRDYEKSRREGYILGAKLVRGAYLLKERNRAKEMGYPSPIQVDKAATDRAYDDAIRFCVKNYQYLASCNASHNLGSNLLQAELIAEKNLPRSHPHLNFCQLLGMSDNITFNLSAAGFNVAKYVVYGPVREVVPYLIRRAHENSSVTGDMSRELSLIVREIQRRGI
ncbi:MAG TPA: proline dehydrogenase family protein [Saprospiraceae bacterium]|nr:proline dehydrogenase family protein [Saprospiraceae bacterium]